GHLASENDDPNLKTFKSLSGGKLCGDITARSLQKVTLPMAFDGQCDEGYSVAGGNSLLDILVGGCQHTIYVFGVPVGVVTVIAPTQPDGPTPGAVHLSMAGTKVMNCTGGGGWDACLDVATYSSAFLFTSDRVIAK